MTARTRRTRGLYAESGHTCFRQVLGNFQGKLLVSPPKTVMTSVPDSPLFVDNEKEVTEDYNELINKLVVQHSDTVKPCVVWLERLTPRRMNAVQRRLKKDPNYIPQLNMPVKKPVKTDPVEIQMDVVPETDGELFPEDSSDSAESKLPQNKKTRASPCEATKVVDQPARVAAKALEADENNASGSASNIDASQSLFDDEKDDINTTRSDEKNKNSKENESDSNSYSDTDLCLTSFVDDSSDEDRLEEKNISGEVVDKTSVKDQENPQTDVPEENTNDPRKDDTTHELQDGDMNPDDLLPDKSDSEDEDEWKATMESAVDSDLDFEDNAEDENRAEEKAKESSDENTKETATSRKTRLSKREGKSVKAKTKASEKDGTQDSAKKAPQIMDKETKGNSPSRSLVIKREPEDDADPVLSPLSQKSNGFTVGAVWDGNDSDITLSQMPIIIESSDDEEEPAAATKSEQIFSDDEIRTFFVVNSDDDDDNEAVTVKVKSEPTSGYGSDVEFIGEEEGTGFPVSVREIKEEKDDEEDTVVAAEMDQLHKERPEPTSVDTAEGTEKEPEKQTLLDSTLLPERTEEEGEEIVHHGVDLNAMADEEVQKFLEGTFLASSQMDQDSSSDDSSVEDLEFEHLETLKAKTKARSPPTTEKTTAGLSSLNKVPSSDAPKGKRSPPTRKELPVSETAPFREKTAVKSSSDTESDAFLSIPSASFYSRNKKSPVTRKSPPAPERKQLTKKPDSLLTSKDVQKAQRLRRGAGKKTSFEIQDEQISKAKAQLQERMKGKVSHRSVFSNLHFVSTVCLHYARTCICFRCFFGAKH